MDKKRSVLNVSIAITTKVILLLFAIVLKRLLIDYVGDDANGVYALYTSIIGFLTIADLGVGTAINFAMYKPIVEGNEQKVCALYNLYKKVYMVIGIIILGCGLAIMPLLPTFAKEYNNSFNLYLTFAILLASILIEYAYSCKTSLINAYKNNYINTLITSLCDFIRRIVQAFVLVCFRSFELYLTAKILSALLQGILVDMYAKKHYKNIVDSRVNPDSETKNSVVKHTKALFMHKIGTQLIYTTDSIIISAFLGVTLLGYYSNYVAIMTAMVVVLKFFFTPLTAIIGHLCAEGNVAEQKKYFDFLYYLNFTIGIIFFLGYYAIIDNIIMLWVGESRVLGKEVSIIITINYFLLYMRETVLLFRDASGAFYYDRWKPVISGIINIILSIAFVYIIGLVGVILATILTSLFASHTVEPYVLFKHTFNGQKATKYYIKNYSLIAVFCGCVGLMTLLSQTGLGSVGNFFANGFISVGISLTVLLILFATSPTYRSNFKKLISKTFSLIGHKKTQQIPASETSNLESDKEE